MGHQMVAEGFVGLGGPKGLPAPIAAKLEQAYTEALKDKGYLALVKKMALAEDYKSSKEFPKFIQESFKLHGELIQAVGLDRLKGL